MKTCFALLLSVLVSGCATSATAQERSEAPTPPQLPDHGQLLSGINESSVLTYNWLCAGDDARELDLGFSMTYPQPRRPDGSYYLDPTWQVEELRLGDEVIDEAEYARLSEFMGTLQAVYYVAGRCFREGAEIRVGGLQRPEHGGERVDSFFRVP